MSFISLFSISIGLGMDAFAVAICKGLSMRKMNWKNAIIIGLYFGIFQGIMPIIGYVLGVRTRRKNNEYRPLGNIYTISSYRN